MAINQWDKDHPERRKEVQAKYDAKRRTEKRLEYKRDRLLEEKYGLLAGEYRRLYNSQEGRCKICGTTEAHKRVKRRFAVDHCHKTGKVRGLLCNKCNVGLGMFEDNIESLISAISYLKENQ